MVFDCTGNYVAAKGGLQMLTRAMAAEWGGRGIHANRIAPGYFETDLTRPLKDDPKFNQWICARTPVGRWGQPGELRGLAIFLASPASSYVNGQAVFGVASLEESNRSAPQAARSADPATLKRIPVAAS